jgi:hypothetical protein
MWLFDPDDEKRFAAVYEDTIRDPRFGTIEAVLELAQRMVTDQDFIAAMVAEAERRHLSPEKYHALNAAYIEWLRRKMVFRDLNTLA